MIIQQSSIFEGFRGALFGKNEKMPQKLMIKQTQVLFRKYIRNESMDLHEILCGVQLLSCEPKFEIS